MQRPVGITVGRIAQRTLDKGEGCNGQSASRSAASHGAPWSRATRVAGGLGLEVVGALKRRSRVQGGAKRQDQRNPAPHTCSRIRH